MQRVILAPKGEIRPQSVDIEKILREKCLAVHYQPIVSLKDPSIIGYEALIRGIREFSGELIPPIDLFTAAKQANKLLELDRLCRSCIFDSFGSILEKEPDALLFFNFEGSILDIIDPGNGYLLDQIHERGINPSRVVIEIIESKVENAAHLKKFVEYYKYHGFLVALDDVGAGHSNFDRIPLIKPDIMKIDRSILRGIERDHYKQEIFSALGNLARKTGILVLAEGLETEEEVLWAMELNADLAQGYFFGRPAPYEARNFGNLQGALTAISEKFREHKIKKVKTLRKQYQLHNIIITSILEALDGKDISEFNDVLVGMVDRFPKVEALYIVDKAGMQVTETVLNKNVVVKSKAVLQETKKGDDLSFKEYVYLLIGAGLNKFVTDSYVSLSTGNQCRTITNMWQGNDGNEYVVCVDVAQDMFSGTGIYV